MGSFPERRAETRRCSERRAEEAALQEHISLFKEYKLTLVLPVN